MDSFRLTKASEEELKEYREKVIPLQNGIFSALAPLGEAIYLTGGTALARFYYNHRISEDLDFFTRETDLRDVFPSVVSLLKEAGFEIEIVHQSPSFARLFANGYKLELATEFNHHGELIKTEHGIYVNNLEDIGANKITAWEDRAELRDVVDLYYITKDVPLQRLFEIADRKRVPVAYEKFLAINTQGIQGEVSLIGEIPEEELRAFVNKLVKAVNDNLKKKEEEAFREVDKYISRLLWDFPKKSRRISPDTIPILRRRIEKVSLPIRRAIERAIAQRGLPEETVRAVREAREGKNVRGITLEELKEIAGLRGKE
ncbi:nucleotidyl transferase AbiEii/AbiGii toxin family protein [Hydrogenivirga sp. 128-5-R1-1]|uniref:nucleotidyl transferase AbiEii/AbiGii toxin family protein n=1 Tax=Hydrogenivirga sp. 128-5-R1-1 TaxID=392423 RepID=UPI00015EF04C|nr:nucleotidyl transferase AbiEii/AbiGii toxin family protein [Hydrogenivirga sp. 128-5-R1-1]EDP74662.1 hypothetical protein HG1285_14659 [Hydrogenivirga sp. 128-5-R1-1]